LFAFNRLEDVDELFSAIINLQLLENCVWIVNERVLTSNHTGLIDGLLGVRLHHRFTQENLLIDATNLLVQTFSKFINNSLFWSEKPLAIDCSSTEPWTFGKELYRFFPLSFNYFTISVRFFFLQRIIEYENNKWYNRKYRIQ